MFVIAIRSYLLQNAAKEGAIQAYTGKTAELEIFPPSLYDVLKQRKEAYFDGEYPRRKKWSTPAVDTKLVHGQYSVSIYCPNELLDSLLMSFRQRKKDKFVARLCNYDLRQGLEVAKAIIQFPFYDWASLATSVWSQYQSGMSHANQIVTFERLLDAIVRKTNILCEPTLPFFDNVFMVDTSDHYANSLDKLFIMRMLNQRMHSVEELREKLACLGHPDAIVTTALDRLLFCNIVTSPQGISLTEHSVTEVYSHGTSLCSAYLDTICCSLYYVQAMAYYTPLEEPLSQTVPLPAMIGDDDRNLKARVTAASLLIKQLDNDLEKQKAYIAGLRQEECERARRVYAEYGLDESVAKIRRGIRLDLHSIRETRAFPTVKWLSLIHI